jgi:hypothetical protein
MDEKRKHTRYPVAELTYVVGLQSPGLVTDVSEGGLGVRYKGTDDLPDEMIIDLLNVTRNVHVDQVRCRKVRDEIRGKVAVFSYVSERRLGLQFVETNIDMLNALAKFMGKEN